MEPKPAVVPQQQSPIQANTTSPMHNVILHLACSSSPHLLSQACSQPTLFAPVRPG
jgi:hypothetical protein